MANDFKQRVCNARDLAATLNDIADNVTEGKDITDTNIIRLENNDDVLITWREGSGGGGGGGGGDVPFVVRFGFENGDTICDKTFAEVLAAFGDLNTEPYYPNIIALSGDCFGTSIAMQPNYDETDVNIESFTFRFWCLLEKNWGGDGQDAYQLYEYTLSADGVTFEDTAYSFTPAL